MTNLSSSAKPMLQSNDNKRRVTVLFFGAARDIAGHTEMEVSLNAANAGNALEELLAKFPELRRFGRSLLFAVNQEYAQPDREIKDGDELALFPPVSGGCVTEKHDSPETEAPADGNDGI